MVINNINGITPYAVVLLNSNASQSSYGQSQNSLFGNILSPNSNNFDSALFANLINSNRPASQQLSNSVPLLQMILPLLLKLLTGKQESGINNNEKAATSAPVNNSNVFQNQPAASASVNNKSTAKNQPAANIPAANPAGLPESSVEHPEWVSTVENSKLSDKKGASKTIENALKKETSSEKEVITDDPGYRYKTGQFYDKNGVLTKEITYDKKANDSVDSIRFYEDGKVVRSLGSKTTSKGTAEWLNQGGSDYPSGYNSYDSDGKLTRSTEYDHNDKNELVHFTNSKYDENEKLKESSEYTITNDQAIIQTRITKSYDEDGNVTNTKLKTIDKEGKLFTINSDEDGNVISKTTRVNNEGGSGYSEITVDKDGKMISKTTERHSDGKFILTDYDKDGKVTSEITADEKAVTSVDDSVKVIYTTNADYGAKTTLQINDDGTRITTDYDKEGKAISGGGEDTAEAAPAAKKPVKEETFDL